MNEQAKIAAFERFSKLRISLRYWMLGKSESDPAWLRPLMALEYAEKLHCGTRKDGYTPEFAHQLEIAHHLRTFSQICRSPDQVIACALLHDVCEDHDIGFEEIEQRFGRDIARSVRLLTKKHRGKHIEPEIYFSSIAEDPVAALVKIADRIHNLSSMGNVFTPQKQLDYCAEADLRFLPMLKTAKRNFPDLEGVFENLKTTLCLQIKLCRACAAPAAKASAGPKPAA